MTSSSGVLRARKQWTQGLRKGLKLSYKMFESQLRETV